MTLEQRLREEKYGPTSWRRPNPAPARLGLVIILVLLGLTFRDVTINHAVRGPKNVNSHVYSKPMVNNNEEPDSALEILLEKTNENPVVFLTLILAVFSTVVGTAATAQMLLMICADNTARRSANAIAGAIELAREEFDARHRPKVRLRHVWLVSEIAGDQTVEINVVFANIGDAAAEIELWGFTTTLVPTGESIPPLLDYEIRRSVSGNRVVQSGMTMEWQERTDGRVLSHSEAYAVKAKALQLFWVGHIEYRDSGSVDRLRRTNFCRFFKVGGGGGATQERSRFRVYKDDDYEFEE